MSARRLLAFACAALALAPRPGAASDRLRARVEGALAARAEETAAEARASLASVVRDLDAQARAQRAEFDAAAARPLPAKARARLEATRQAWEAAQGRLPDLAARGRHGGPTFDAPRNTVDVLRLAFRPARITAEGRALKPRPALDANGYLLHDLPNGDCLVSIRHDGRTRMVVEGEDPQQCLPDRALTFGAELDRPKR